MKYLYYKLLVILILPISIYASDVYYCVDDDATGFNTVDDLAVTLFEQKKFKIMIDFEQNMVKSKDLLFNSHNDPKCVKDTYGVLNCIHSLGGAFIINVNNLKYYRSSMFRPGASTDDIVIAHGSCEKF